MASWLRFLLAVSLAVFPAVFCFDMQGVRFDQIQINPGRRSTCIP